MLRAWPELYKATSRCSMHRAILIKLFFDISFGGFLMIVLLRLVTYKLDVVKVLIQNSMNGKVRLNAEETAATIKLFQNGIIIDAVLWMMARSIYMLSVIITGIVIIMKYPTYLPIHLFISIPNIILDFLLGVKTDFRDMNIKCFMLIMIGCDFYNILAVVCAYKEMTKKKSVSVISNQCGVEAPDGALMSSSSTASSRSRHTPSFLNNLFPSLTPSPTPKKPSRTDPFMINTEEYTKNIPIISKQNQNSPGEMPIITAPSSGSNVDLLKTCIEPACNTAANLVSNVAPPDCRPAVNNHPEQPMTLAQRIMKMIVDNGNNVAYNKS